MAQAVLNQWDTQSKAIITLVMQEKMLEMGERGEQAPSPPLCSL